MKPGDIDIHWVDDPLLSMLGIKITKCECGQFSGTWEEYLQHCKDAV